MSPVRRFLLRLATLFRPGRAEAQLAREIDAHLGLLQEQFERRGMAPDEARRAARRAFGGVEQAKEIQRASRSFRWLEDGRRDVGYACRTLRRTPAFTAVAVLTLALGIGAVTVIYSVLRYVLLDPFPYTDSRRMVDIVLRDPSGRTLRGPGFPAAEFLDYQENTPAFEDVVGTAMDTLHWERGDGVQTLSVAFMTPNGFTFLGVRPLLGRVFGPADAAPNAPPVGVMNHRTWMTLFGGDPNIVGRTLTLNGRPWTVVGVMPPRFEWNIADLWVPYAITRSGDPPTRGLPAFQARLRRGVTIAEAEAQLDVVAARRAVAFPQEYPPHSRMRVITVIDWVVGQYRGVLYTLFAAVSLLLVIACCNVANMLLARATAREREITVRAALGAGRGRIVRQLLAESALLATGGAVGGCLFAYAGIAAVARYMPRQGVPWETEVRLDTPVLIFALATAALATFAFGLFPAIQSSRRELMSAVNSTGRSGTADRRQTGIRNALVIAEVSLSIVLLLGAGLLMRSFVKLIGVDFGIDPQNLLIVRVAFPSLPPNVKPIDRSAFYRRAIERMHTVPGVRNVIAVNGILGAGDTPIEIAGVALEKPTAQLAFCSEEFVDTYPLRLLEGRTMSELEVTSARKVAVVTQQFVKKYLPNADPLGQTVRAPMLTKLPIPVVDPSFTIIGVASDVRNQGPQQSPAPQIYVPYTLRAGSSFAILIRTATDPMAVGRAARAEIAAIDWQAALMEPIEATTALENGVYARPRFVLIVLGMFAVTGVVLVGLGVYGVLAYTVSQRSQEIAIRMALGGERSHVLRLVFRTGLQLTGAGVFTGLAASVATNRLLISQLGEISPYDPATLAAGVAVVLIIASGACWVPAHRAMRVEPIAALRHE